MTPRRARSSITVASSLVNHRTSASSPSTTRASMSSVEMKLNVQVSVNHGDSKGKGGALCRCLREPPKLGWCRPRDAPEHELTGAGTADGPRLAPEQLDLRELHAGLLAHLRERGRGVGRVRVRGRSCLEVATSRTSLLAASSTASACSMKPAIQVKKPTLSSLAKRAARPKRHRSPSGLVTRTMAQGSIRG